MVAQAPRTMANRRRGRGVAPRRGLTPESSSDGFLGEHGQVSGELLDRHVGVDLGTVDGQARRERGILSPFELGTWFIGKGILEAQVLRRNPGSRLVWEGITIRVVGSIHGSGSGQAADSDLAPIYGGAAAGFVITFENGWTVYSG